MLIRVMSMLSKSSEHAHKGYEHAHKGYMSMLIRVI